MYHVIEGLYINIIEFHIKKGLYYVAPLHLKCIILCILWFHCKLNFDKKCSISKFYLAIEVIVIPSVVTLKLDYIIFFATNFLKQLSDFLYYWTNKTL
jgi:hypothetical protein